MSQTIKVLIADDHPIVRRGLGSIIDLEDDIEVIGEAENGEAAIDFTMSTPTDVILMDLRMPGMGGVEAIKRINAKRPNIQLIILTTFADDEDIYNGIAAGARGFLLKDAPPDRLIEAIRAAHRGESLLNPTVAARILDHFSSMVEQVTAQDEPDQKSKSSTDNDPKLTPRELDVLHLLGRGARNKEIAKELHIVERTVKIHVGNILGKLNVTNRTEAVTQAIKMGLLGEGD
ncbi:MAG: response regulator transcription factor [Anaerolineaceae bacterium]|nr:response regulator transcription factor [Anaerolineaceae bacterium]MCB9099025.1 response regulator transcription factor [Anaerolineales bacterium]